MYLIFAVVFKWKFSSFFGSYYGLELEVTLVIVLLVIQEACSVCYIMLLENSNALNYTKLKFLLRLHVSGPLIDYSP